MAMVDLVRPARRGLMLILSSPSGAGKSTLTRTLSQKETNLDLSVSVTTRARRPSEIEGVHYHFIEREVFDGLRQRDELLESAEVHGNGYGTPRKPVEEALKAGRDVLFDIDYQGTQQILEKAREDVVAIFILPPSMAELRSRLVRRAEDAPEVIAKRLANARDEIARWSVYDYVIINDDLGAAYESVRAILVAERLKRARATGMASFVEQLLDEQTA
ncbi:MAG: guanylate kinase [Bosea sp.]|nr:guanylate kinase [Bosea sp. (in: a-proteobacteria)]MBN9449720.1 guanylate kinase [Bosea sp. (in: a-proteobacteria)]MBN9467851.1 guanylate kinase [Bosea sp. (in: a-proteobacteria)]